MAITTSDIGVPYRTQPLLSNGVGGLKYRGGGDALPRRTNHEYDAPGSARATTRCRLQSTDFGTNF